MISYRLGLSKYYVVYMPSMVSQVFTAKESALSKKRLLQWFYNVTMEDGWASRNEPEAFHADHDALNMMLREDFVKVSTNKTASSLEYEAARLVTKPMHQKAQTVGPRYNSSWERYGRVTYNKDGSAEADLYGLINNYMGQIAIDILWGKSLLKNHPGLLEDMYDFDHGIHHFFVKGLAKITKAGRRAKTGRDRLATAMRDWYKAVAALQAGEEPELRWKDLKLDEVSEVLRVRVKTAVEKSASVTLQKTQDAQIVWGVNVNSNKNTFWMLLHVYSRPELLSAIRAEISTYIKVSETSERGPDGFPKLSIDVDGLTKSCPLVKATFYETMRLSMAGLSTRDVVQDIVLTESVADAAMFGKAKAQSYAIPAGSTLVLANGHMQRDPRIFPEPDKFDPQRFIEVLEDGTRRANMRNLHTFGGGLYKCKGRYFAEREVITFVSCLLFMWDLSPADGDRIVFPEMGKAGASRAPKTDVRVKLTRRFV